MAVLLGTTKDDRHHPARSFSHSKHELWIGVDGCRWKTPYPNYSLLSYPKAPEGFKFLMKTHLGLDSLERGQFVNHESIGLPLAIPNSSVSVLRALWNYCGRETGNFSHLKFSLLFTELRMWYNFSVWISIEFISEMKMSGKIKIKRHSKLVMGEIFTNSYLHSY